MLRANTPRGLSLINHFVQPYICQTHTALLKVKTLKNYSWGLFLPPWIETCWANSTVRWTTSKLLLELMPFSTSLVKFQHIWKYISNSLSTETLQLSQCALHSLHSPTEPSTSFEDLSLASEVFCLLALVSSVTGAGIWFRFPGTDVISRKNEFKQRL